MLVTLPPVRGGLEPVEAALADLRRRRGADATRGLAPGLRLPWPTADWLPASALVSGERLDETLDVAQRRWGAPAATAAALAWRSYTYWLAMPVVLGWATARRVPLADPAEVFVQATVDHARAPITFAWRRPRMAVLPHDPVANGPDVTIVTSEAELLRRLRTTLREDHLDPLLAQIQSRVRLGTRTLLGSLASAVAYAVVRGLDQPALVQQETAHTLLSVLDVADLVALEPGPDGLRVQRRTCCLAFTLPEARVCSSCCVPAATGRSG